MLRFCRPKRQSAVKSPSVDLWYADDPPEATGRTPWCDSTLPFSRGAPTQSSCWILSQWLVQCLSSLESPKRYTISWKQISISSVYPVYHQYIQYIISISTFYCGWELRMMRMHRWYGPILAISLKQGMYSVLSFACWLGVPSLSPSISWDHHHPHFDVSHTHTYIYNIHMYVCIYIYACVFVYIYTYPEVKKCLVFSYAGPKIPAWAMGQDPGTLLVSRQVRSQRGGCLQWHWGLNCREPKGGIRWWQHDTMKDG